MANASSSVLRARFIRSVCLEDERRQCMKRKTSIRGFLIQSAYTPTALILFLNTYEPSELNFYSIPPISPQQHAAFVQALLESGARADIQVTDTTYPPLVLAALSNSPES